MSGEKLRVVSTFAGICSIVQGPWIGMTVGFEILTLCEAGNSTISRQGMESHVGLCNPAQLDVQILTEPA